MQIIRVALDLPLSTLFDYFLPDNMTAVVGQRVLVPFGRKQVVGVVMARADTSSYAPEKIKLVAQVLDDVAPLPDELLKLLQFCSDYYHHPIGMTVLSALPTRLKSALPVALKQVLTYTLSTSGRLLDLSQFPKRKAVQLRLLSALQEQGLNATQLKAISSTAMAALKLLLEAGWVEVASTHTPPAKFTFNETHCLTDEQQAAVDAVNQATAYQTFLLHGVTGSGKTEVYVHLLQQVLQRAGQVLLLVPEINLTPQLEYYFRSRFPDTPLVSLHSGLSEGERTQNWLLAQAGQARIILGTRLAVFTPLPQLALIIVDEEHDASFKQQDGLRYSARDVAIFRASAQGVPIVLGSATPSLESYYNARSERYTLLTLKQRAAQFAQLPIIRCLNISNALLPEGISKELLAALQERLLRGEQSLVFINRRGYAPVLMCTACGWLSDCPHCAGKMVLHLKDGRLRCHHCGHQTRVPPGCPSCGNADLQPLGIGTQRIETVLQSHLPTARILRVDRDSTRNKGTWNAMRKQIQDETVDILVGTQMLAKGHDFHNLTLVCVLNPDGALYSGDFRASEKLFAQLAQVSGRAGRGDKPGEVWVQTAFPEHPLFRALRAHDYDTWAAVLLSEREQAGFPPFVYQVLLRAEDKQEASVYEFMQQARNMAIGLAMTVEIYGVVPAALPRRANHIRLQLLIQSDTRKNLQQFLRAWKPRLDELPAKKIRWSLDVDPLEF
jgi:primosomal protein N' (replication factor Y) (superfamily II helicase)